MVTLNASLLGGLVLTLTSPSFAEDPPALVHNPFARPPSEVTREDRNFFVSSGNDAPTLQLNATLVGTGYKLANVAGRIMRPGDEVDGFRLLEVYEDHAVFLRAGSKQAIYVKPELVADDE